MIFRCCCDAQDLPDSLGHFLVNKDLKFLSSGVLFCKNFRKLTFPVLKCLFGNPFNHKYLRRENHLQIEKWLQFYYL